MGAIFGNGIVIHGNFAKVTKRKPKGFDQEYKIMVPYRFKWRNKLGRATCDCKEMLECYQPWYGYSYYHEDNCAISKHLAKYPQMQNFFWDTDPSLIARSE